MFFMLFAPHVYAQDTSAHTLNEAMILQNRYDVKPVGYKSSIPDSFIKEQFNGLNLSDLLSFNSSFFVKSYGGNGIATTSIRGGTSAQSAVNWNGFNINSAMLGQSDLSIFPGFFFDDVTTVYGGNASLGGSGAIGGTIFLKNNTAFSQGIKINAFTSSPSFGLTRSGAGYKISTNKFVNTTRVFINAGKNDYVFGDTIEGVYRKQRLEHSKLLQFGLLQENVFKINRNQKIGIHAWLQKSDKQIPSGVVGIISRKSQQDASIRASADWQLTKESFSLFARSGVFYEEIFYVDSNASDFSKNRSLSSITELESKIKLHKNHLLDVGLNQTIMKGITSNYASNPDQLRYAVFTSWQFENTQKWFSSNVSLRQEIVVQGRTPFTWNTGFAIKPFSSITVHGNVGRVFRLPSLDDLYWINGGNQNLKPEYGYAEEIGLEIKKQVMQWNFFFDITGFNREIKDMITWLPSGSGGSSPVNIQKVWSRGCETQSTIFWSFKKFKIQNKLTTNYVVATYQKAINENDESVGHQLVYSPMYSGANATIVSFKELSILYNITYTGYRYTTSDNYGYLSPYFLHYASLNYQIRKKKIKANVFVGIDNVLNRNYMVVPSNPMPLRYFKAGINIEFNK
ncbi:MAG: TonB-dependent receptor [Bacteroidota bacterium]|nr:TonB-dependent receptor [Bacteroidota bacterium]